MTPKTGARREPEQITRELLRSWPLPLDDDGDKFERGTVLVVGGSVRTPGAVLLAGVAALRAGAGRLQIATVDAASAALAVALPEALVEPLPGTDDGEIDASGDLAGLDRCVGGADAVLVGPGLAGGPHAAHLLRRVFPAVHERAVVVLDAHALDDLDDLGAEVLDRVAGRLVLTPNRGECRRLVPTLDGEATDAQAAAAVAARFDAVVSGHGAVATAERTWCDPDGGVGLATSGSGDVLAGLVAGLAARTGDPVRAACWGTHVHLTAGARLADRVGTVGFLARELADEAPAAMAAIGGR